MDFGYFKRSRKRFWSWLVTPPLLMGLVYAISSYHSYAVGKELNARLEVLSLIPQMEEGTSMGKEALSHFRGEAASADIISSDLQRIATAAGFRIDSLLTAEPRSRVAPSTEFSKLEFKIIGETSLVAYMKFLNEVQKRQQGLSLINCGVVFKAFRPHPVYQAEVTLLLHKVTM
ncbi:MAG: hypothetical protein ACI9TH_002535 [Kiritimatiellia bacterium]|jgi:hypothetical protein